MRNKFFIALLIVFIYPVTPVAADFNISGPEKIKGMDIYIVTSNYQEKPCDLAVLLPDKIDKKIHYRVLYLLPAIGGKWEGMDEVKNKDLANKYNIICVAADFSRMSWYADSDMLPNVRYDSYLPDIIVPFIDKTYPTIDKPEGRILVGFSKSGVGAISLLIRHSEIFGRAGAWDAVLETENRSDYYCSNRYFKENYFLPDLLTKNAGIFIDRPARIAIAGLGWGGIDACHKRLEKLKIPHFCDETIVGNHSWDGGWLALLLDVLMSDDMIGKK
jgi:hypothetical protein